MNITENQLIELIHRSGLRPSVQRLAILSYIGNARTHPSADEIYLLLHLEYPTLSRTTVYNSLHALVDAGLVRELEIESGNKHYDLSRQAPHSHFICRKCRRIFDMKLPDNIDKPESEGFIIDTTDVYYKGLCPECNNTLNTNN